MSARRSVGLVFGTRPEAIKMAPVIKELQQHQDEFESVIISTAQHRQMLDQVMSAFEIEPTIDLNLMTANQSLSGITRRVLESMDETFVKCKLDCVLVQGDTTTAFAASLAAFYRQIPVAHVEAGLRSRDIMNPFPEEVNRRLTAVVTGLHFAPTPISRGNLVDESVDPSRIVVTGNTVVDAAHMLEQMDKVSAPLPAGVPDDGKRIILVTLHRRESWGVELGNICDAIAEIVANFGDVRVIYPVHLNPHVTNTVQEKLGHIDRVHLTAPMDYFGFISQLRRCYFVLTDSGGVQEEAPTFGKPVLVARTVTERPEASMLGLARIVGTSKQLIVNHASELLTDHGAYRRMSEVESPYGDGKAAARIASALSRWLAGASPVLEESEQFKPVAEYIAA